MDDAGLFRRILVREGELADEIVGLVRDSRRAVILLAVLGLRIRERDVDDAALNIAEAAVRPLRSIACDLIGHAVCRCLRGIERIVLREPVLFREVERILDDLAALALGFVVFRANIGRRGRFLRAARRHVVRLDELLEVRDAVLAEHLPDFSRKLAVRAVREYEMARIGGSVAVVGFIIMPVGMDAQHALRDADNSGLRAVADRDAIA